MNEIITLDTTTEAGVSNIERWAKTLTIATPAQHDTALAQLKEIKSLKGRIVDFFRESKESAHRTWKAIVGNEKAFTDRLDNAERDAKTAIMGYQRAEEEKRMAEQRKLQAIADEQARKEREKLAAQAARAEAAGKTEKAAALAEAAAFVAAPVVQLESKLTTTGSSIRKTWKARLTSLSQLTGIPEGDIRLTFVEFNESAANRFAAATKGQVKVPGIEFFEDVGMSVRTK